MKKKHLQLDPGPTLYNSFLHCWSECPNCSSNFQIQMLVGDVQNRRCSRTENTCDFVRGLRGLKPCFRLLAKHIQNILKHIQYWVLIPYIMTESFYAILHELEKLALQNQFDLFLLTVFVRTSILDDLRRFGSIFCNEQGSYKSMWTSCCLATITSDAVRVDDIKFGGPPGGPENLWKVRSCNIKVSSGK